MVQGKSLAQEGAPSVYGRNRAAALAETMRVQGHTNNTSKTRKHLT